MKKIEILIIFVFIMLLVSCKSIPKEYKALDKCIDQMIETNDNEIVDQETKTTLLSSYIKASSKTMAYTIHEDLTYASSSTSKTITFGVTFYGNNEPFTQEDVINSMLYFDTVHRDFNNFSSDVYFNFSIRYDDFDIMKLLYTQDMLYKKLDIEIDTQAIFADLYYQYEDLIIDFAQNRSLDSINIWIKATDYELKLSLKLNLSKFDIVISQMDSSTTYTFDDIFSFVNDTMKKTNLSPNAVYET